MLGSASFSSDGGAPWVHPEVVNARKSRSRALRTPKPASSTHHLPKGLTVVGQTSQEMSWLRYLRGLEKGRTNALDAF